MRRALITSLVLLCAAGLFLWNFLPTPAIAKARQRISQCLTSPRFTLVRERPDRTDRISLEGDEATLLSLPLANVLDRMDAILDHTTLANRYVAIRIEPSSCPDISFAISASSTHIVIRTANDTTLVTTTFPSDELYRQLDAMIDGLAVSSVGGE